MDSLTHTLAGAALGEAGLKRLSGLGMAALVIGANIPDVDVLAGLFDNSLTFRRGWTHGPLGILVLPVLLATGLVLFDRWQGHRGTRPERRLPVRFGQLLLLSYIGALSHPALDWLNTYGIRLLMPFSEQWFYGDTLFIIDPWVWLALGLGILFSRYLGRTMPARSAVALTAIYIIAMSSLTGAAEVIAGDRLRMEGEPTPERLMASPVPLDSLQRRIVYDLGDRYRFATFHLRARPEVSIEPGTLPVNADHPVVRQAVTRKPVADFLYWARFPFFIVEEVEDGWIVHAIDARYNKPDTQDGWARVSVHVQRAQPEQGR